MDGILVIDKPAGLTSHDVVSRVRRILKTRRVGHTGTLDPFATGVLVVMIGKATRLAQFIDKDVKEYEAVIQFGWETDTGDVTGKDEGGRMKAERLEATLAETEWDSVFSKFRGEILQTPPMYSAKKVEGKKLYELAREGVTVERKPVQVIIHELDLLPDENRNPKSAIRIRTTVSAGTYIRTLAEDIGREIRVGAHLTGLRRTGAGQFALDDAMTLEQLEQLDDPSTALRPFADAVEHLPAITLPPERIAKAKDGLPTRIPDYGLADGVPVRIVDETSALIAVGIYNSEEKSVKPKIVLV